jgi:hypothetical protein
MEHQELKNIAFAVLGFLPEWSPKTCDQIIERVEKLNTIPAAYLGAVMENLKIPGNRIRYANVILSTRYDKFIPEQLQLLKDRARVRLDSDMVEFRSALLIHRGDYRGVLEDAHVDISCLGKYWIAKMYGYSDLVTKFAQDAALDALANPFLDEAYKNLQEDDKG